MDPHAGRLLEVPHDRLFVVSKTETLPEVGQRYASAASDARKLLSYGLVTSTRDPSELNRERGWPLGQW